MEVFDVFPTKVLVNENADLNINHQQMMEDIDMMIEDGTQVRSPLYQSYPILFQNHQPHWSVNWDNLQQSFKNHVEIYLAMAREQYGPPEQYVIDQTTAWFYRKDMNNLTDTYSNNPMHNHFPSQVVGVYYLDNPGFDGTTLYNPNTMMYQSSMSTSYGVGTGGWIIFPRWMQHSTSSTAIRSSLERTVIACNAYLKVVD